MLGFPHPRHLLRELTSQEVTEWIAYYEHRPFGFARESQLFGTLAAQNYAIHKSKGADKGAFDFFPIDIRVRGADGRDSDAAIIEMFKQYNISQGYTPDGKKKLTEAVVQKE